MKRFPRLLCLLLVSFLSLHSCSKKTASLTYETLEGLWIVGALEVDTKVYRPIPNALEFKNDSIFYRSPLNEMNAGMPFKIKGDSIAIDTISRHISTVALHGKTLQYLALQLQKPKKTEKFDTVAVETMLRSKRWKNTIGDFQFNKDGTYTVASPNSERFNTFCYALKEFEGNLFLLKSGNHTSCDGHHQFLEQVLSVSATKIETYGFSEGDFKTIQYTPSEEDNATRTANPFQLCNKYLYANNPSDRYYYQGTEVEGGNYYVRKMIAKHYKKPENSTENGIFQVRFVVNCEGKTGMFETQGFDFDYKLKEINPVIASQLVTITKNLKPWKAGRSHRNDLAIDTYIHISYRIENGTIVRVFP